MSIPDCSADLGPVQRPPPASRGKFLARLLGHLILVVRELVTNLLGGRISVAPDFFLMRLATPFGFFRARSGVDAGDGPLAALRQNGLAELTPIADTDVADLARFFRDRAGVKDGREYGSMAEYFEHFRSAKIQRPSGIYATGRGDCAITKFAVDDRFLDIASKYLEIDKSKIIIQANVDALVRLEGPRVKLTNYDDALEFHRDVDSYRFLKIFVYLTDCFRDGGHHEVYLGSHRHTPVSLGPIARYSNAEIEQAIPDARLHLVEGKAGYAFAEDTFAFHRGTKPLKGDRLILNMQYMDDAFSAFFEHSFKASRARAETGRI